MNNIDVAIVANTVDRELHRSLRCIFQQRGTNCNVYLVLDQKYLAVEPLAAYGDRLILISSLRNGLTEGLILSIVAGESEFVARADRGDVFRSDRYISQLEYLQQNPRTAIVGCTSRLLYVDKNGKIVRCRTTCNSQDPIDLSTRNPIVHGSVMIRREAYDQVGGYDGTVLKSQDLNLYLRLLRANWNMHVLSGKKYCIHKFYIESSSTINQNKKQIMSGMASRIKYLDFREKLSVRFVLYIFKSAFLLAMPNGLLKYARTRV